MYFDKGPTVGKQLVFYTKSCVVGNSPRAAYYTALTCTGKPHPGHSLLYISEQTQHLYRVLTSGDKVKCPIYTYTQMPIPSLLNSLVLKMAF